MGRLSVTARIALLTAFLSLLSSLVAVGIVHRSVRRDALAELRLEVAEQADAFRAVWRSGGAAALRPALAEAADDDPAVLAALLDARGRVEAGSLPGRPAVRLAATGFAVARVGTAPPWSEREAGYALVPLGDHWLIAGRALDREEATERALARALLAAAVLAGLLGVGGGLAVARYVARRLDAIAAVAEAAGAGDLSRRVGQGQAGAAGGRDAFDRLSARIDAMLARVEGLVGELRLVSDSLAHDLRSPLARLRVRAEAAATAGDADARDAALGALLAETDAVMRMLSTATEIARADSGGRDRFEVVAPAVLLAAVADLYQPVMEEAGLRLAARLEASLPAMAVHRELLSQAVANLLDNALKYAGGGGEVVVRLSAAPGVAVVAVEDRGPGIAAADQERALRRFGRLDEARSRPGAGLGLALADAVARLHGGRLELGDNAPGLVARLILPTG